MSELLLNFWQLFLVSAPWLLLGLILAGLLNVFIPKDLLQRHLGQEGFWTTVKAALIGAPMPLCSCGVIPAAVGLRRAGGSKSATTAFLVSTPETGVDSISVSYVLLGPFMAVIRPIAAICSAITAGVLVGREKQVLSSSAVVEPQVSCCAGGAAIPQASSCCDTNTTAQTPSSGIEATASDTASCCATQSQAAVSCGSSSDTSSQSSCCESKSPSEANGLITKLTAALTFSCNKLLSDTAVWLLIGLFFAALVQTFVPESFLSQWGSGILAMTAMILISIPMYICATASTPIAAGLLLAGVSPGAVLVFMLAGPATNIATIGVVGKELGQRAVLAYLTGVIAVAVLFGFITDFLVERFGFVVTPMIGEEHQLLPAWLTLAMGLLLAALLLRLAILNLGKVVRR
ncbi:SO_0444 family Cu/Zn efflux transporter [Pseudoalteromonas 'SMAR']|uniref:SO_0444 family Cu/Zn efflux transporter n=1 Tax=Pseudoalteromonas 'SMAR' TaxID=3416908 RepID=UPI003AF1FE08